MWPSHIIPCWIHSQQLISLIPPPPLPLPLSQDCAIQYNCCNIGIQHNHRVLCSGETGSFCRWCREGWGGRAADGLHQGAGHSDNNFPVRTKQNTGYQGFMASVNTLSLGFALLLSPKYLWHCGTTNLIRTCYNYILSTS